eukprot:CAMPEP_0204382838 /NCGR_PEP_ID=MMETSP0469-20131031/55470_1 /ASSEMBLY_ACC=CAM_ASM_000384 /TAXON_ID=2969 /ORGANISM="Oxyrrhis marina" /LENGTH=128 /DNA_ID=CAMNT_0051375023 /DNA_START=329 /DNA_END=712 /DNA_ORIENTATION=+
MVALAASPPFWAARNSSHPRILGTRTVAETTVTSPAAPDLVVSQTGEAVLDGLVEPIADDSPPIRNRSSSSPTALRAPGLKNTLGTGTRCSASLLESLLFPHEQHAKPKTSPCQSSLPVHGQANHEAA